MCFGLGDRTVVSVFYHVCNKYSGHIPIVLPKSLLCFAARSMVAAAMVYQCDLRMPTIFIVIRPLTYAGDGRFLFWLSSYRSMARLSVWWGLLSSGLDNNVGSTADVAPSDPGFFKLLVLTSPPTSVLLMIQLIFSFQPLLIFSPKFNQLLLC